MLNVIPKWSIAQRWLVVFGAIALTIWSLYTVSRMPLDVLPNFAPPQVEVQTEAPGLAPEAVESLVTLPLESAVNGTPGVEVVRTSSAVGISVLRVVFKWGTDPYQARQLVAERLQDAQDRLPEGIGTPQISPLAPPIGTVIQYAFTSETTSIMDVRRLVDGKINNRLLAVPGVSQVLVYGGDVQQFQVIASPEKMKALKVSLQEVVKAANEANAKTAGGLLIDPDRELVIRGQGQIQTIADLQKAVVKVQEGKTILLRDVAEVKIGAALQRGDASWNRQRAVVVMVNKQPLVDSPTVTKAIIEAMEEIKPGLPKDVKANVTFRQDAYIDASVGNVRSALIEGSLIVAAILIPFLMNWRTLSVCLFDFFLTLLFSLLVCSWIGLELNTMTLGGLVVAIGTAVDDAIVYCENTYRRLRENRLSPHPKPPMDVIFEGSQEVRESLIGATLIGIIVFSPIFTLSGVEGRIFTPMGIAYLVVVVISSLESLIVSPALCAILLPHKRMKTTEPFLALFSKRVYHPLLKWAMRRSTLILGLATASMVASMLIVPTLGRDFLPTFQERSLMNAIALYPGSSLEATNRVGLAIQTALKDDPRFESVQLRSGRAPGDPDAASVNLAHLDVELSEAAMKNRPAAIQALREVLGQFPGVAGNVGGFISHRMDEVLSGVRSAIAIKVFGNDLQELRRIGEQIETTMKDVKGLVDLQLEPQIPIRQVQIQFNRDAAARYGLTIAQLSDFTETALNGRVVGQVPDGQQLVDVLVWVNESARRNLNTIRNLQVNTPTNQIIPLSEVAKVDFGKGPNTINRENVSRLIVVSANVQGRDVGSVVDDIRAKVKQSVQLPQGYYIQYGGQYESEQRAAQNFLIFGILAVVAIAVLMYFTVKSVPAMLMVMVNLPLALVGGVISVLLTGGVLSVPSMVGFVTLFGVATRNGLLLVDNYNTKLAEGMPLSEVIVEGSMERLLAILMTALTSALGMIPLVLSGGAGKELLQPLAIVVLGGLFTSTALTLLVLPALYARFGKFLIPKRMMETTELRNYGIEQTATKEVG
ncbi:efflux RND transporter permease subunit [Microcoleus sp. PH2017_08_TRC_O_A]|uniref:efflux RND transporter permease subunit n=1 Tax=Microcoleus sp. PH2017_08_TRC_O_A TaxID=2798819 RepID=UPI001DD4F294|nr:efflux RND transporter permease subunit [Microcoleus sp. PH2017_08_TRC_O_A]MCC3455807.1 efflux RND transporter permease subunit [Microcoleus sp. PH2017_08_TRC_O_A]